MLQTTFPRIEHIDDLRKHVAHKKEIIFSDQPNGTTVVCYAVQMDTTFDTPFARECRGITFDTATGLILSRPFHKFFRVNEIEETLIHNIKDTPVLSIMDKRDGSMITPVLVNGEIQFKSKKSFTSDVALEVNKFVKECKSKEFVEWCRRMIEAGNTPIFEYTAPTNRIVINYEEDADLVCIGIRKTITGEYVPIGDVEFDWNDVVRFVKNEHPFVYNRELGKFEQTVTIEDLMKQAETVKGIEGWIVSFNDGEMVKVKTAWYDDLHHVVTFVRERDIAEMVLNETIDDVKAKIREAGKDVQKVIDVERRVVDTFNDLIAGSEALHDQMVGKERKEVALEFRQHPLFGLAIQLYSGKEPNYKEFFNRNVLKEKFGLEVIV